MHKFERKFAVTPLIVVIGVALLLTWAGTRITAQEAPDPLEGVIIRPLSEIVSHDFEVTDFASDGTALLHITTDIPVACSVIYGTTTEFGQLSVGQDMGGGATTDHNPLLTNLEPETTYYYRLQGTDAQGILYISPVLTFTTPARVEAAVTNLASPELGAEITGYSSAFSSADPAARWGVLSAVDGSANSAWSSAGDGDEAWLEIRLAQPAHVERIEYWSRSMSDGTSIVFSFTITTDNGEIYGPFDVPDANQAYSFDVDFEATTLRFDVVSSSGGNTGAVEFGVYGR